MPDNRLTGPRYNYRRLDGVLLTGIVLTVLASTTILAGALQESGPAPNFELTSTGYENGVLGDPVAFNLSEYRGQTVVLDMMAVNCAACRVVTREILEPLQHEYGHRDDFVILSIDTWADSETGQNFGGETLEQLVELQMEDGVPWRHALDTDDVWRKYQAVALPKVVVVNPEGLIVYESAFGNAPRLDEVQDAVTRSLDGSSSTVAVLRLPLLGLAVLAGVAAFFAPCSVGLIPAYMGLLLRQGQGGTRILWGGIQTGLGVVSLYALLAIAFWQAGTYLQQFLGTIQLLTGFLLIIIGASMFRTGLWDGIAKKLGMGRVDGRRGFFLFGLGFGLASFGCTGPAFLPILLAGFLESAATGFLVFALYGGSLVALMLLAAGLVATGRTSKLRAVLSKSALITRISAALFVLAGLYVLWFKYRADGALF